MRCIVDSRNNITRWYRGHDFHREDGPAVIYGNNGMSVWYHRGKIHRIDGPAITRPNGQSWFLQNIEYFGMRNGVIMQPPQVYHWARDALKFLKQPHDEESVKRYIQKVFAAQVEDEI